MIIGKVDYMIEKMPGIKENYKKITKSVKKTTSYCQINLFNKMIKIDL